MAISINNASTLPAQLAAKADSGPTKVGNAVIANLSNIKPEQAVALADKAFLALGKDGTKFLPFLKAFSNAFLRPGAGSEPAASNGFNKVDVASATQSLLTFRNENANVKNLDQVIEAISKALPYLSKSDLASLLSNVKIATDAAKNSCGISSALKAADTSATQPQIDNVEMALLEMQIAAAVGQNKAQMASATGNEALDSILREISEIGKDGITAAEMESLVGILAATASALLGPEKAAAALSSLETPPSVAAANTVAPKTACPVESKAVSPVEPRATAAVDAKTSSTEGANAANPVAPKAVSSTEPKAVNPVEAKVSCTDAPKPASTAEPKAASAVEPKAASAVEPKAASAVEPKAATTVAPKVSSNAEPTTAVATKPKSASSTEPKAVTVEVKVVLTKEENAPDESSAPPTFARGSSDGMLNAKINLRNAAAASNWDPSSTNVMAYNLLVGRDSAVIGGIDSAQQPYNNASDSKTGQSSYFVGKSSSDGMLNAKTNLRNDAAASNWDPSSTNVQAFDLFTAGNSALSGGNSSGQEFSKSKSANKKPVSSVDLS